MGKLELKHLAGYLPYGLKCLSGVSPILKNEFAWEILGFEKNKDIRLGFSVKSIRHDYKNIINIWPIKPILHPLSDLTKEIDVNGEKFVPLVKLAIRYANSTRYNDKIAMHNEKCYCYSKSSELEFRFDGWDFLLKGQRVQQQFQLFERLYEWHFDIHSLIEKGLAIDINTLE